MSIAVNTIVSVVNSPDIIEKTVYTDRITTAELTNTLAICVVANNFSGSRINADIRLLPDPSASNSLLRDSIVNAVSAAEIIADKINKKMAAIIQTTLILASGRMAAQETCAASNRYEAEVKDMLLSKR